MKCAHNFDVWKRLKTVEEFHHPYKFGRRKSCLGD